MFGFSLQKLVVLVAIIAAVWYGFKLIGRLDAARKAEAGGRASPKPKMTNPFARWRQHSQAPVEAEDMEQCSVCGAYVPARNASNCGRPDCPH